MGLQGFGKTARDGHCRLQCFRLVSFGKGENRHGLGPRGPAPFQCIPAPARPHAYDTPRLRSAICRDGCVPCMNAALGV